MATTPSEMNGLTIRNRVLEDHRRIRAMLIQIDTARRHLGHRAPDALEETRKQVRHLVAVFQHHLALEEQMLAPCVAQIDAWGPVRVERMLREHREQRLLLKAIASDIADDTRTSEELADELAWLVDTLLRDMEREEKDLLDEDLLRDDGFVVDQSDG